jgi:hypothetical protein
MNKKLTEAHGYWVKVFLDKKTQPDPGSHRKLNPAKHKFRQNSTKFLGFVLNTKSLLGFQVW